MKTGTIIRTVMTMIIECFVILMRFSQSSEDQVEKFGQGV